MFFLLPEVEDKFTSVKYLESAYIPGPNMVNGFVDFYHIHISPKVPGFGDSTETLAAVSDNGIESYWYQGLPAYIHPSSINNIAQRIIKEHNLFTTGTSAPIVST
jgi:hypothetical protein